MTIRTHLLRSYVRGRAPPSRVAGPEARRSGCGERSEGAVCADRGRGCAGAGARAPQPLYPPAAGNVPMV